MPSKQLLIRIFLSGKKGLLFDNLVVILIYYSTVTTFARFLGWSISVPSRFAI